MLAVGLAFTSISSRFLLEPAAKMQRVANCPLTAARVSVACVHHVGVRPTITTLW